MKISLPKLKAILLYFANNTNVKYLGKTKLMKLFYFLDFRHVKRYGAPVTYDTYVNLDHGPIPSFIKNMIDSAADDPKESSLKDVIKFEYPTGTEMARILPQAKFTSKEESLFTPSELEILKEVVKEFGEAKTEVIEKASHKEAPWRETAYLERIPYTLAALDKDSEVSAGEIDLLLQI